MARLHEAPTLGDSLDARELQCFTPVGLCDAYSKTVKRRFIRQNREIARANSNQSIKIRALECESSRLLSENITLREENIHLQKALEDAQRRSRPADLSKFKDKLESKVRELHDMLGEMNLAVQDFDHATPSPNRARRKSHRPLLPQRPRATTEELAEIAVAEGRLAPIVEDGYSPVRTLQADEIRISIPSIADFTDSPELSLPPAVHYEDGDPVKRSPGSTTFATGSPSRLKTPAEEESGKLSSYLETRRRRRDSASLKADFESGNLATADIEMIASKAPDRQEDTSLKTGAKRKFAANEDESKAMAKTSSQRDLKSGRRRELDDSTSRSMVKSRSHVNLASIASSMNKTNPKTSAAFQSRRALSEKSVNTDPVVSPAKPRSVPAGKPSDQKKENHVSDNELANMRSKPVIRQIRPLKPSAEREQRLTEDVRLPPVTPAAFDDDIFSPSSRPSTVRAESKDTPPPTDLTSAAVDAGARPSRRQRSSVSYAEPNLRDKMRRPGKEMVDAVTGVHPARNFSSEPSKDERSLRETSASYTSQDAAKDLELPRRLKTKEPTSPLTGKSSSNLSTGMDVAIPDKGELPSGVLAERRRRTTVHSAVPIDEASSTMGERQPSGSRETIAALISSSNKKLARVGNANFDRPLSTSDAALFHNSASVYDLHLSSPISGLGGDEADVTVSETKPRATRVKRHSSVTDLRGGREKEAVAATRTHGAAEADEASMKAAEVSSRRSERAERRRSMMV